MAITQNPRTSSPRNTRESAAEARTIAVLSASAEAFGEEPVVPAPPGGGGGGTVARNTAIFSFLTGISRVVGLLREVVFAGYFGTTGFASAYAIAYQVPNYIAQLFAQSALSAAFVPVFTDLLQKGRRTDAVRLASTLFWIMLIGLGAITAVFILAAGLVMPLFIGPTFSHSLNELTVGLSRVLFPVILLLGLNGLLVGVLQSYDEFTIPALSPAVWNIVIIVLLVLLAPHFHGEDKIYAFTIGILAATVVQVAMAFGALGRIDFRLRVRIDWHDPRIRQVFALMLPVMLGLGIVNLDQLINAAIRQSRLRTCAERDQQRVSHLHAAAGGVQRRGRHSPVPDAQPYGLRSRTGGDATRRGQRHAPDQPTADSRRGVHARAADADRAARVPAR